MQSSPGPKDEDAAENPFDNLLLLELARVLYS
jgi:hypothetical protein